MSVSAVQHGLERSDVWVDASHRISQHSRQLIGAGEEHVALVGEVARERAPGQAGSVRDLGDRDVVVATLEEQFDGGRTQPLLTFGIPPGHRLRLSVMTHWDMTVLG